MKSVGAVVVVGLVGVAGYFLFFGKGAKVSERAPDAYKFTRLAADVAAQVELKNPALNDGKSLTISFQNVLDEHYKSLVGKKNELLFLAGYEQFVRPKISSVQKVSFKLEKPARPLAAVCSQYGVDCQKLGSIQFDPRQSEFLFIDGASISLKTLQQNTVPLLGVKTEMLNHILQKIDDEIRSRILYRVAKEAGLSVQAFIEEKIISAAELTALSDKEITRLMPDLPNEERSKHLLWMKDIKKNQATDIYLQKNYLDLPILVNIEQPQNDFKTRWEWTPYFGEKPGGGTSVVLFADFFSDASHTAIRNFLRYKDFDYNATFGIRPYFSKTDNLQMVAAEVALCVWSQQPKFFWAYLEKSLSAKRDSLEADLHAAVTAAGANLDTVKKCVFSQSMKKVVEYHIQSAEYLKIINPPVYFIGNEVHVGPLANSDFEKMLLRQPQ